MFVRIITVPALKRAFRDLETIQNMLSEDAFPALSKQEGWLKTVLIYNKEKLQFKVITYWTSKEHAGVLDERDPELSSAAYLQVAKFAEYFKNENLTVEHFDHLETIEKSD
ncbi:MAG: hypothetical protein JSV04_00620 [Candidatus Heimdallarchaeota archaeon]|nr:MAG: hypothetical protein JSV04_00620 [Candidatus Heimdallarchaeota archaeon]